MRSHDPFQAPSARSGPTGAKRLAGLGLLAATLLVAACGAGEGGTQATPSGSGAAAAAGDSGSPASSVAVASPTPPRTPGPTLPRVAPLQPPAFASRVVVAGLEIDLPVISGDLQPPPSYPFCDVAAYVTRFNQPYESGVTYISAHAQPRMFLPLLEASQRADGAELLGMPVSVFTSDGRRFDYRIERVVRHAVDYAAVGEIALDERHLILQTSEGPYGTLEKLQVMARFESEAQVEPPAANPSAQPRDCRPDDFDG